MKTEGKSAFSDEKKKTNGGGKKQTKKPDWQ